MVIAYFQGNEATYLTHGFANPSEADPVQVDSKTLFEIGSISKPMVGMLLAQAVSESELTLETPIKKILTGVSGDAGSISLKELAVHRSGLPRLPDNLPLQNIINPYAEYRYRDMLEALNNTELQGRDFVYSNFGFGVLANAIARWHNKPFDTLIAEKLFEPLNMSHTRIAMGGLQVDNLANGHDLSMAKVHHWTFDALAGAGAVLSNAEDMIKFGRFILDNQSRPEIKLFLGSQTKNLPELGLGIFLKDNVAFHTGQTGGFGSFFAVDLQKGEVVVVLTNVSKEPGELGFEVLQQISETQGF